MRIREVEVKNRIVETGATNDFVAHIKSIVECQNNIAVILDKYTLVLNKNGNFHKLIYNKFKKDDTFDYDKITCTVERLTWYYPSFDGFCHSDISTYRVLGIINRIMDDGGETFTTYNGYEVNHKLPRVYKQSNKVTNLEVCSEKENKRHYYAWQKCQVYEELIPLQMSALDKDLIELILNNKTVIVDKDSNHFTLRNYELNNEITEYKCIKNPDGIWRFNG